MSVIGAVPRWSRPDGVPRARAAIVGSLCGRSQSGVRDRRLGAVLVRVGGHEEVVGVTTHRLMQSSITVNGVEMSMRGEAKP